MLFTPLLSSSREVGAPLKKFILTATELLICSLGQERLQSKSVSFDGGSSLPMLCTVMGSLKCMNQIHQIIGMNTPFVNLAGRYESTECNYKLLASYTHKIIFAVATDKVFIHHRAC